MKKLTLLLLIIIATLTGCENIQDNQTSVQASVDGIAFSALYSIGNVNLDGSIDIQTSSDSRVINLHLSNTSSNSFNLNGATGNYATYTDVNGNTYTTQGAGTGTVEITDRCESCGTANGKFNFIAIMPGIDTVAVSNGLFVDVVIGGDTVEIADTHGTFSAQVDSATFTPSEVNTIDTGNFILIEGKKGGMSIILRIPKTVEAGEYNINSGGFNATIAEGLITQNANNGDITITSHDKNNNKIQGTFTFQVGSTMVSVGQFQVQY
tara:strand:+ start:837 stop:1634 length:798 start_codon:yes stop_codon:yes gene_type:complete